MKMVLAALFRARGVDAGVVISLKYQVLVLLKEKILLLIDLVAGNRKRRQGFRSFRLETLHPLA